jgi:hypothetical protein
MSIPLDKIITFENNVYEMTSVAIMEAQRLANRLPFESDKTQKEKLVSQAIASTLEDEVEYLREE